MLTNVEKPEILYLSKKDILELGGGHSDLYVNAIHRAFELHAEGNFVQPLKPYLRSRGKDGHIADRIIAMPAHIGHPGISGIKWVGSKHDNPRRRGLERASALIILNDPETNYPIAIMEGSLISGMRTAAVTVVASRFLAKPGFKQISCIGCGVIARMQLFSMIEQFPQIETIHLFDLSPAAADQLSQAIREKAPHVRVKCCQSVEEAVKQGEVVITCTVAEQPYIPFDWIQEGTFISNVSIMDFHKEVFLKADKVIVDDWEQSNREKKVIHQLVLEGKFSREQLHAELGEIVTGQKPGRENDQEIILLNPMGMAIEDIACAEKIYHEALKKGIGTKLSLY
ncbi:2,3-diaminopropionate biosynthesis protein SbnB [Lihuaxuella thermophila]|uniref:Ornithine cyclodeaminase n=1 Tax=Lihuaxuella thermophila TaxID=1173111 RepID=A0A1H8DFP8_9BACL|nr:2,3-diaminopropionate biosynthesis protein SbnB [Lihuaxuella thermophila]SEN05307.1 ornithine cyclodeaminase [Lihuaxuella thermophila]